MNARQVTLSLVAALVGVLILAPAKAEAAVVAPAVEALIIDLNTGETRKVVCTFAITHFYFHGGGIWVNGVYTFPDKTTLPMSQPLTGLFAMPIRGGTSVSLHVRCGAVDVTVGHLRIQINPVAIDIVGPPGTALDQHLRLIARYLFNLPPANLNALLLLLNQLARC